ncbi:MAG: 50S ribosomal protein L18 [Candidatus Berkelbacteria bacterium]|nr:50S ribosomal protein L18 [Candidatus Berkelbacteria bacterium]
MQTRNIKRKIRKTRIRKKIFGTKSRPRLCVFKSNRHIYAQVINDEQGKTIVASSDLKAKKGKMLEKAKAVGEDVAKKCKAKKITEVVFDRGGYKYTGLIKILSDAAREKGLKF